ncbi:peptidoglycan D,D-transpeptidase FtsI family protein [Lacrimispora saccharolytica]|uniref:peptidoglycan D,D-transpeptidase FtsI family protein n=1 Tax=Lacrimispora saccharolytica TaxID=84030 RepID=UPI00265D2CF5|nr:penicillin-binding protein 2 [Lacrimispora saccharolytica]
MVLLAFAGLGLKLLFINMTKGEQYKKTVLSQQSYDSITIPYKRGDILDSNGNKLATSDKVYNLIIDAKQLLSKEDYLEPTMTALKTCFPEFPEGEVRAFIASNPNSQYYVTLKQLEYERMAAFVDMQNNTEEYPNIKGVWFEEEYRRVYPNGSLACDVIGFTGKDNVGNYGLEQYYNSVLNGTNGREYGYLNDDETLERTTIPATDGYNIVSTIDGNIQQIVERYIKDFNDEYTNAARSGNGARNVGCIIMDVNNGNVLAMAGYPVFDLNNPRDTSALIGSPMVNEKGNIDYEAEVISAENIDTLLSDDAKTYQNLNYLWKNFCISATYEPGSVAKPFTVAAGLESGKMSGNEYYTCNGQLHVGDHDIKCHNYKSGGDGTLSVQESIEKSCNVALMLMGKQIGKSTFLEYQEKFNFGLKTNIDLYGESRTSSLVFNTQSMGDTELATSTFGQGYNVTMIQTIAAFASLINGGYYYEPHVVKQVTAPDGSIVENISPRVLKQTVSASTSELIRQYCKGVVDNGTGKTARPAGYSIGGKTGTAETVPRDKINYVVSFMGFAPADNPQIAIYVVVDRPNAVFQDDAKFATKIVRNILTEVLPYMNIYMTEELSDKEREELDSLESTITSANTEEEESEVTNEDGLKVNEDGTIDAQGGDVTSSTEVTPEEMESDDVLTAPLTGTVLDTSTGEAVREVDVNDPE